MKYREEVAEGQISTWRRARQIVLDNPHEGAPQATCYETDLTVLPNGEYVEKSVGNLTHVMDDLVLEIPLVDPDTLEPIATTFTAGEFALMATSVYLFLARQRDGGQQ